MDGTPVGLQRWEENQPNPNTFDSNCVAMTYYMGEWSQPTEHSIKPREDILDKIYVLLYIKNQTADDKMFLIASLLDIQASGKLVIVAKSTSPFVNEEAQHLSTALQRPQFPQKVAAHSSGPNLTQRSEITINLHSKKPSV